MKAIFLNALFVVFSAFLLSVMFGQQDEPWSVALGTLSLALFLVLLVAVAVRLYRSEKA